jgi:hypothetical protein
LSVWIPSPGQRWYLHLNSLAFLGDGVLSFSYSSASASVVDMVKVMNFSFDNLTPCTICLVWFFISNNPNKHFHCFYF